MQGVRSALLILLLPLFALADPQGDMMLSGGGMRFQGTVLAESCNTEVIRQYQSQIQSSNYSYPGTGDQQLTISMGQSSLNDAYSEDKEPSRVPLALHLQDCKPEVSQRVGITFHDIGDSSTLDVLTIGKNMGNATDIGITLFDAKGRQIPLDSPLGRGVPLYTGADRLHFFATYQANDDRVIRGAVHAQVSLSLTYQ